jgi:hypothetical protein
MAVQFVELLLVVKHQMAKPELFSTDEVDGTKS